MIGSRSMGYIRIRTAEIVQLRNDLAKARTRITDLLKEVRELKAHRDSLIDAHESVVKQLQAIEHREENRHVYSGTPNSVSGD